MAPHAQPRSVKQPSALKQKELIVRNYDHLTNAHKTGEKVVSTFVAGNLNELMLSLGLVTNMPEINAIQSALRKSYLQMIMQKRDEQTASALGRL